MATAEGDRSCRVDGYARQISFTFKKLSIDLRAQREQFLYDWGMCFLQDARNYFPVA